MYLVTVSWDNKIQLKYRFGHFDEAVYRYNKWMRESTITEMLHPDAHSKRERKSFAKNGFCKVYSDLSGKVSFGVRDYYYDWEF